MNAIEFEQVSLRLGSRMVLSDISFALGAGEFIGVLGPNGAGKSTLMRAILGLITPSAGAIRVLGDRPDRSNRLVGYLPQRRGGEISARISGFAFVASVVGGGRLGLPVLGAAGRREVAWALDLVGARDLARRPLAETSGGERQRLLLAQALIGRPRLLLLDEPLISLDPRHQQGVVTLAKSLQDELKITVLFSAHDVNPLLGAIDRVLYLGGGGAALGSVDQVISGPVLSKLYGAPIEVIALNGRIFVMSGHQDMGPGAHHHETACAHV